MNIRDANKKSETFGQSQRDCPINRLKVMATIDCRCMSWLADTTSAPVCCYHPRPGMRLDGIDGVTDTPAVVNDVAYFGNWTVRYISWNATSPSA